MCVVLLYRGGHSGNVNLKNTETVNVCTDGSVQREVPTKSGWGLYAQINGVTAMEKSGANRELVVKKISK